MCILPHKKVPKIELEPLFVLLVSWWDMSPWQRGEFQAANGWSGLWDPSSRVSPPDLEKPVAREWIAVKTMCSSSTQLLITYSFRYTECACILFELLKQIHEWKDRCTQGELSFIRINYCNKNSSTSEWPLCARLARDPFYYKSFPVFIKSDIIVLNLQMGKIKLSRFQWLVWNSRISKSKSRDSLFSQLPSPWITRGTLK